MSAPGCVRSLLPYGACLLCAATFPAAHWCPLWVTAALGAGSVLLGALTAACAVQWWRAQLRADAERAALNGERDLQAAVDATRLKHKEAL